jgi:hypothetical protein
MHSLPLKYTVFGWFSNNRNCSLRGKLWTETHELVSSTFQFPFTLHTWFWAQCSFDLRTCNSITVLSYQVTMFTGHSFHTSPPSHISSIYQQLHPTTKRHEPRAINRCTIVDALLCINSRDPWPERCCHSNLYFLRHCYYISTGEIENIIKSLKTLVVTMKCLLDS